MLSLRSEEGDEARRHRDLILYPALGVAVRVNGYDVVSVVEERRRRPVIPHFKPRQKTLEPLIFVGSGELLYVLTRPGREALGVVEVFIARSECDLPGGLRFGAKSDSLPVLRQAVTLGCNCVSILTPVVIDEEVEFSGEGGQEGGVDQVAIALLGVGILRSQIVVEVPGVFGFHVAAGQSNRHPAVHVLVTGKEERNPKWKYGMAQENSKPRE